MISRVGGASALASSVAIPAHQVGDLIVMFAYRTGVSWPSPSLPDEWTKLDSGGSGLNSYTLGFRFATSTTTTSGTWSGASAVVCLVYRTTGRWKAPRVATHGNPIGNSEMSYPDLPARPGNAWFIRFAGNRTATNMQAATPLGWTSTAGQATRVRSMDTNGPVIVSANEVGGNTQTVNTSVSWRTATVSIAETEEPTGALLDVWNKIPASATVLSLSGMNFNLYNSMPNKFQGMFSQFPYSMERIKYPASLAEDSISRGVAMLDEALLASTGNVIVLAHSQGAQVCRHWMEAHRGDATREALASRVAFLLSGNPCRYYGGSMIGQPEVGGTIGQATPIDTVWPIVDVARRYDGWCDHPGDAANNVARRNAELGKSAYHLNYDDRIDLYDPSHAVWTEGNTTFVLSQESPPLFSKMKRWAASVRDYTRHRVEQGYVRVGEAPIEPAAPPNFFWQAMVEAISTA